MNRNEVSCNDGQLRTMLNQPAGGADQEALLEHVEQCPHCQMRLEQLAANADEWQMAGDALSSGAWGDEAEESGPADREQSMRISRWTERPVAWTESMAKQLLAPPSHPEMLGRLGRYEVERLIGTGGMGVVFKAFDTELNRSVAIKVLAPYLCGSGPARQRFAREARAAAAVVHDHVVPIHNVETEQETPYLVMQYVAGESLQARLDREGSLGVCELLRIGMQVAAGLAAAHSQGLVHRDIKPSNILLEPSIERALITDFGLARAADDASITNTGFHPGTPQYMSPEQAAGETVDARSDLFSLGSVLYAMCTGRSPFRAESCLAVLRRIADSQPRCIRESNPSIPEWLERIVMKLLAKNPDDRFASASEVATLLEQCLAHVQQPTVHPIPTALASPRSLNAARLSGPPPRKRSVWKYVGLTLLSTVVGLSLAAFLTPFVLSYFLQDGPKESEPKTVAANGPGGKAPQLVKTIKGMGLVARLVNSPDGRRIAVVSYDARGTELRVVDANSGQPVFVVPPAQLGLLKPATVPQRDGTEAPIQDGVSALEFSPDGRRIALGTLLGEVKILDAQTGAVWRTLNDESFHEHPVVSENTPLSLKNRQRALGGVRALAFSPDGNLLAVGGESFFDAARKWSEKDLSSIRYPTGQLKVWNFRDNTVTHCNGHSAVTDVAFSADGRFMASAGRWDDLRVDGGGVILWKPESSEPFHKLPHPASDYCLAVRFVPDSTRMVSVVLRDYKTKNDCETLVRVTDVNSGKTIWERSFPSGVLVQGCTADNSLGLQDIDWTLHRLNGATGESTLEFRLPWAPQRRLPFESNWLLLPQHDWLVLAPPCNDPEEGRIEIWSLDSAPQAAQTPTPRRSPGDVDRTSPHASDTDVPVNLTRRFANAKEKLPSVPQLDTLGLSVPADVLAASNRLIELAKQSLDRSTPESFESSIARIISALQDVPAFYRAAVMHELILDANEPLQTGTARETKQEAFYQRIIRQCALAGLRNADDHSARRALYLLEWATPSELSQDTNEDPNWPARRRLLATLWLKQLERIRGVVDPDWDKSDRPALNNGVDVLTDPKMRAEHERRTEEQRRKAERYHEQLLARQSLAEFAPRMEEDLIRLYVRKPLQAEQIELLLQECSTDVPQRERIAKTVRLFHVILPNGTQLKYGWPDGLAEAGSAGVEPLIKAVGDKSYPRFIRWDGAWALGLIGDPRALPVLKEVEADETTPTKYKDIAREFVRMIQEKTDHEKELAGLQGRWCFDVLQSRGWPQPIGIGTDSKGRPSEKRWLVQGNQISWLSQEGRRIQASFTIDPTKNPKQIDVTFLNGPHRGAKCLGIYERQQGNQNYLWLCLTDPGTDAPRPTEVSYSSFKQQSMIGIYTVAAVKTPSAAQTIERLQGVWKMDLCDSTTAEFGATQQVASRWQWTIQGNEILWKREDQLWKMKYEVDPSRSPNEIDITYLDGPFQDQKCLGMFVFGGVDGQTLMISIQDPGSQAPRPKEISMRGGTKTALIFLRPSQTSDIEREFGSFQGTWKLKNVDTSDRPGDAGGWPLPQGKSPDGSGAGSELRWTVKGKEITWTDWDGQPIRASFSIDPMKSPKQIDLTFLNGPHQGATCLGIYQRGDLDPGVYKSGDLLDEDILWICIADPNSKAARPKEFSYRRNEGRSLLSLYPASP